MSEETKAERLDRELGELLQELRVMLPGVQVLFAFLLIVPFSDRFDRMPPYGHAMYLTALMFAALASACLISPSAFHRLRFRARDKERMLRTSNRFAIVGTVFLAIAMVAAILFVADFVYALTLAVVLAAVLAALIVVAWYVIPLARR